MRVEEVTGDEQTGSSCEDSKVDHGGLLHVSTNPKYQPFIPDQPLPIKVSEFEKPSSFFGHFE